MSNTAQMCGWLSAAMARASDSNRARRSGRVATSERSSLSATRRSEPGVARLVDLPHAAGADERLHFVRAEHRARGQRHVASEESKRNAIGRRRFCQRLGSRRPHITYARARIREEDAMRRLVTVGVLAALTGVLLPGRAEPVRPRAPPAWSPPATGWSRASIEGRRASSSASRSRRRPSTRCAGARHNRRHPGSGVLDARLCHRWPVRRSTRRPGCPPASRIACG